MTITEQCQERGNSFLTIDPVYRLHISDHAGNTNPQVEDDQNVFWNDEDFDSRLVALLSKATIHAQSIEGCWSFGYCRPTSVPETALTIQGRHYFANVNAVLEYLRHTTEIQSGHKFSLQLVADVHQEPTSTTSTNGECAIVLELIHLRITGSQDDFNVVLSNLRLPSNITVESLNTLPGGFSNLSLPSTVRPHSHVTVYPIFQVSDWERCLDEFVTPAQLITKTEVGCLFYGFHGTDKLLFCREIFVDGAATLLHMEAVKHLIQKLLHDGILTPLYFSVMGPMEELDILEQPLAYLKPVYQKVITGFDRIERL